MRCRLMSGLGLLIFLATPLFAQPPASHQRGLDSQTVYQQTAFDQVNLFNGNLTLRLPIGQPYPVSSGLSYGLTLAYNANGWDYDERSCNFNGSVIDYFLPQPVETMNAGFGWSLQLGRMEESSEPGVVRWTYTSPDGSEHTFRDQLHFGIPSTPQSNTWFSQQGSYLRLKRLSPAGSNCAAQPAGATNECLLLEFPNGTAHEFRNFPSSGTSDWRVTRVRDRYTHNVDIDYGTANRWKLVDQQGRTQTIHFSGDKVSKIDLTAFGGTTATYTFEYVSQQIDRQRFSDPNCAPESPTITVDVLRRLVMPDGSFYEMAYNSLDGSPEYLSGALNKIRLPTGGEFRWTYQWIDMLTNEPSTFPDQDWSQTAFGIASKEIYEQAGDPTPIGTWTYDYETLDHPSLPPDEVIPCYHTVTVTDPLGHQTLNYFSSASAYGGDYALPYTRCDPHNGGAPYPASGLFLSQEIYDGTVANGSKQRSVWARYESSGKDWNHRMQARKVVYHDDGDRFRQEEHFDFDGFGHYRKTIESGNWNGTQSRTLETDYHLETGVLNPSGSSTFSMPSASTPWIWTTFTEERVTESGQTATTQYCSASAIWRAAIRLTAIF